MRLRNIPGAKEEMLVNPFVVQEAEKNKGRWKEYFGTDRELHLEIGTGKGRFITELAQLHPDINYVGIEKYSSVLLRALEKRALLEIDNLFFMRFDAEDVENVFAPGEVDRIYLNFSDPWPKDRHAKRRLTSVQFLRRYEKILKKGGLVEFKTDNTGLFEFSVESAKEAGWEMPVCTHDLHNSVYNEGNIMTEYEERFSGMGNKICKLVMRPGEKKPEEGIGPF